MFEDFATTDEIIGLLSSNIDIVASFIDKYMSGANHLRLVSIVLITLALILFLFLIVIVYVKSIVSFLRNDVKKESLNDDNENDIFDEEDEIRLKQIMDEQELEKELQRELDRDKAEKEVFEKKKKDN